MSQGVSLGSELDSGPEAGQTQQHWSIHYIKKTAFQELLKYIMSCGQGFDVSQTIIRCDSEWEKAAGPIAIAACT